MEEKEIKTKVPTGYEIDKENSTFECIKFKPIKKKLPKTWKEFCETHSRRANEAWVNEYAEAMLALCKLIQLRDCYNDGWVPDWTNNDSKSVIYIIRDRLAKDTYASVNRVLAFKSADLRDQFYVNFRDLIEIAKPLL